MYVENGHQIAGLLTESEIQKMERHKSLNEKEFLERAEYFNQMK